MKVLFRPEGCIPLEQVLDNVRLANLRGLPHVKGSGRLALVGGGPSAARYLDELRAWPGEVWGINGAASWLVDQGIAATFVTVHPMVDNVSPRVRRAVLGEECSPELFDALSDRAVFLLTDQTPSGQTLPRGGTTATAVAICAPLLGFTDVSFFGCEGSYAATTHNYPVYQDPAEPWVIVRANGETFRTKAEFLMQSRIIAEFVHAYPFYEERSGGLLAALVQDHDYDVTDMAPSLLAKLDAEDKPYGDPAFHDRSQSAA